MKFLVITKGNKHLVPPEALLARTDALTAWVTRYTEMGKIDAAWSFAGVAGGGAIFNVDSLEELDAIMVTGDAVGNMVLYGHGAGMLGMGAPHHYRGLVAARQVKQAFLQA